MESEGIGKIDFQKPTRGANPACATRAVIPVYFAPGRWSAAGQPVVPQADQHLDSSSRLAALRRLRLLDTPGEANFDRLTRLVGQLIGVPICLVSLVDDRRQFFKSAQGLGGPVGEARETPLTHSFCQHVVTSGAPLVVDNAPAHPLVCDNLAIRDLGVKAYLGIPIRSPDGFVVGSFCAIDVQPRVWSPRDVELLTEFTGLLETEIELRAIRFENEIALARHQGVLDGTTSSVIATALDGTIEVFSAGAQKLLGYTAKEMVGRKTPELIHLAAEVEARAVQLSAEFGRPIAPGFEVFVVRARSADSDEREWTYVCKDGSHVPVLLTVTALRDGSGTITGFLGIARDITERINAREAQENLAELLRQTGAMAQVGGWELNLVTMRLFWTLETCRIHEVDPPVAPSLDQAINFFAPEARPVIQAAVATAIADGTGWDLELPLITASGRAIWVRAQGSVVQRQGVAVKLVGVFQDITARRVAEAARRESEERFRALARHAPVGIYLTDVAGGCLYVNDRWCEITGLGVKAALGNGWTAALHPEDRGGVFTAWQALARGVAEFAHEYRFRQPDGSETWVSGQAVPMRDATGAVSGFLGTIANVTERRRLVQSLAIARDQALEGSRLKSEFLATMSHEIRTPMNGVLGMAGLLMATALSEEQRQMATVIERSADSLLVMIDDILDFSKIEAGKLRIEPAEFDLRRVVEDTAALLAPRAHEKGLKLICHYPPRPPERFVGDGGRVRQVLVNLLGNAVKFTEAGEVRVAVEFSGETETRSTMRLEIRDTGVGIPREAQHLLFQPFVQVDGTAARRFGGTGLGLAISRQLVELMGGAIGFASAPGAGSTFWIELSLQRGGPASPAIRPDVKSDGAGLRLLVVEDNQANQLVVKMLLARMGHAVEIAADGEQALARLAEAAFDAVLMDCQMPGLDGYETTRRIRAGTVAGGNPRIPVIALTAYARPEDRAKCLAAGMNDYVSKPLRVAALSAALERHVTAGSEGRETGDAPEAPSAAVTLDMDLYETARMLPGAKGPSLLPELVALYLRDESERRARIGRLLGERQGVGLAEAAHAMGGNAATFGGLQVQHFALELERAARAADWPAAEVGHALFLTACADLRAELARRKLGGT